MKKTAIHSYTIHTITCNEYGQQVQSIVEEVLAEVDLTALKGSLVGSPGGAGA